MILRYVNSEKRDGLPVVQIFGLLALMALGWQIADTEGIGAMRPLDKADFIGQFNGERALEDVKYQVSLGARTPGSAAHRQAVDWIAVQLQEAQWQFNLQEITYQNHPIRNIIARWGQGRPWLVVGAHYDSRQMADRDPNALLRGQAVPGANDGASGVAVLLEIARNLPALTLEAANDEKACFGQVWLLFFDAEDQGGLPGWEWILGSRAFVSSLDTYPNAAVIVDMIGDTDLNIFIEQNSDTALSEQIWSQAQELGFSGFIAQPRYRILDDHVPFLEVGTPGVDIIDFDYPYWHTTQDLPEKVSAESLRQVGETLLAWLFSCQVTD